MNRLFGGPAKPAPTLDQVNSKLDDRVAALDAKITRMDADLQQLQRQLTAARAPTAKETLRQQALQLLSQRRLLLAQRQQFQSQSLNLFQVDLATSSLQDSADTLQALRVAKRTMDRQLRKLNPDVADVLGDEVNELLSDSWEVQELLGRSYDVSHVADADDLEAELRALEVGDEAVAEDILARINPRELTIDLPPIPTSPVLKLPDPHPRLQSEEKDK